MSMLTCARHPFELNHFALLPCVGPFDNRVRDNILARSMGHMLMTLMQWGYP
ncbi:TPA: hypothetical protein L9M74_005117 [Klebsiella pneumoniae]|nr:hypothetical protein [Klebsiella pneumoniae]